MLLALFVTLASVSVSGRVVEAGSHAPIAGARVILVPEPERNVTMLSGSPREAISDADGHFVLEVVEPGRYRLDALKKGFAPLLDRSSTSAIVIVADNPVDGLELALTAGATISGRIVEATGTPRPHLAVSALKIRDEPGDAFGPFTAQIAETDEDGEFALRDLPEGRYLVLATPGPQPPSLSPGAAAGLGGSVVSPTYYPGTVNKDEAQVITVAQGQVASTLQFSIVSVRAYQVGGVAVDDAGAPVTNAMMMLIPMAPNGGMGAPLMALSDGEGTFRIDGVVPGTYHLIANGAAGMNSGPNGGVGAAGVVVATGGVWIGGVGHGGAGVPPSPGATMPIAVGGVAPSSGVPVTVGEGDVSGIRVVVPSRR